jgi:LemA protein
MSIYFIVFVVLVTALLVFLIGMYNGLVKKRILTQEAASGIGACLQQRNDLIPNLVETVKGYAGHENKTLTEVVKWRNQSAAATGIAEQSEATVELNAALNNMMAVAEAYPKLKADGQFRELMTQLAAIEEKINDARRYYNGTVRQYNQDVQVFPKNLVAGAFGFKAAAFFAEAAEAHTVPAVKFPS